VAAAVAAKEAGARVFLAAPRPYLGEDICGTYRLWLEPGEAPKTALARKMFAANANQREEAGLSFTYQASLPSAAVHADSKVPSKLRDGLASSASHESVQYDGDVILTADLGKTTALREVALLVYQRPQDFAVGSVSVQTSVDNAAWSDAVIIVNDSPNEGVEGGTLRLAAEIAVSARYLRLTAKRSPGCERILIGELVIHGKEPAKGQAEAAVTRRVTRPMQVKKALDDVLLAAGVDYLYGCYATDILRDKSGAISGIVMANRSGRQAVRGKVIIDATSRAVAARLAGAEFAKFPSGKHRFKRVVLGGKPGPNAKSLGIKFHVGGSRKASYEAWEYELELRLRDASWKSFAKANQQARNETWQPGQVAASEMLYHLPPDPLKSRQAASGPWPGADKLPLDALRPAGMERVYVLGGCAEIAREAAVTLLRPLAGMDLGARVGQAAAAEAAGITLAPLAEIAVSGESARGATPAELGEMLHGVRGAAALGTIKTVVSPARGVPVIGRYDTVVVGGGTGGGPAGVGAARGGARTLVIEYLHGLGGVGTLGRISKYYHGNRVGFTTEIDKGVGAMESVHASNKGWNIENKMEWLRSEIDKAGGDVWFQCLGAGSIVRGKRFVGVLVATPFGRGAVLANTVIDATGNAVIPACAGLEAQTIDGEHISVQGTGLPSLTPGESYLNSDWTFVDDDDVLDMWRIHVVGRQKYAKAFDQGQLIDTRARRRIIGDTIVSPMDIINKRTYPDIITVAKSNFDNHGFSSHSLFMVTPPDKAGLTGNVPYSALLPKGYDGILVTGLGMSAHGDAMPVMRMQPDVQNQGYAAGRASAMAAENSSTVRRVDIKKLQQHLVEKGIVPKSVLTAEDSYPIGPERMTTAVQNIGKDYSGIALVLTDPKGALPILREAYTAANSEDAKLRYAHVLGMLHDATGSESLIKAVAAAKWDKGWNFRGMGQFGATTSKLDNLIIALGRTGNTGGVATVIDKLKALTATSEFSHSRACAIALEIARDARAAQPLAAMLQKPGVGGHAFLEIDNVIKRTPSSTTDHSTRNNSLRELVLARALYRCGDHEGLGKKTLEAYARDYRGHYARHARAVLSE
jgi:flavin-dependent dehydrogenase